MTSATAKDVNVDLRADEYFVSTYSRTVPGFWVLDGCPVRLPGTASPGELGTVVRAALDRSRHADSARALLDMAGVKDYGTYMKGTRSVDVYADHVEDGESVEVTPQRNEGPREGFAPMTDHTARFTYDSPGQIGVEVINAFDKAT
jgi:hypothetical protein